MAGDARTRVLLAVAPRLLGDVLVKVLAREDLDVVVHAGDGACPLPTDTHFDVAVASACLPQGISVDTIIRLPDSFGNAGVGAVVTLSGEEAAPMRCLDGVVDLFDRLCPRREPLEPLEG